MQERDAALYEKISEILIKQPNLSSVHHRYLCSLCSPDKIKRIDG